MAKTPELLVRTADLGKSAGYKDASARLKRWEARVEKADGPELLRIRDEKDNFFRSMSVENRPLFSMLAIRSKTLSERIFERLTGKRIIID